MIPVSDHLSAGVGWLSFLMQRVVFLVLEMMVLVLSWTFWLLLFRERLCILLKSFILASCWGSTHWAWPAFAGWQEVQLRYPRMNMSDDCFILRASFCGLVLVCLVYLVLLGFPLVSSRAAWGDKGASPCLQNGGTRWGRSLSHPQTQRGPGVGCMLELGLSSGSGSLRHDEEERHFPDCLFWGQKSRRSLVLLIGTHCTCFRLNTSAPFLGKRKKNWPYFSHCYLCCL